MSSQAGEKGRAIEKGKETGEAIKSKANEAKEQTGEKASEAGEYAKETTEAGKEKSGGFFQQTGEKMKNMAQCAAKAVKRTFGMATDEPSSHQDAHTATDTTTTQAGNTN